MAYSDSARVTANTARITTTGSVQTSVRDAANTFGDAIETAMTTYGAGISSKEKQAFRDMLVDVLRMLDTWMNK